MKMNLRMVILSNYGLSSNGGGVSIYTHNLVDTLMHKGNISIHLLIREGIPTDIEEKLSNNELLYTFVAIKKLNALKPEVVLSQGGLFKAIPLLIYKKRYPHVRAIYLFHTHYDPPKNRKDAIRRKAGKILMSFVLSRFDRVLFVSKGLRENLENVNILKVPPNWGVLYGAPLVRMPLKDEIREFIGKFDIHRNKFYILAHGLTASPAKVRGAKLLIDTLTQLPENIVLILTRKGPFISKLKEYAESKGVSDRVIFTGDLKNPHVATLASDVYTHITYGEGLPLALLEVMSIGKPIIASNVGGIPEAIRHPLEGILVKNREQEIFKTVLWLMENPKLRRKMAIISRRALISRFSWEKTANKLLRLVER